MEIILFMLACIGPFLRFFSTKWIDTLNFSRYDTTFCRDVRVQKGKIQYSSDIELKREKLNNPKSKF